DTLDFSASTTEGATVDLSEATIQDLGNLTLVLGDAAWLEDVVGTAVGDDVTGNATANRFTGSAGGDTFRTDGAGGDTVTDFASGETVDLPTGSSVHSGSGTATVTIWDGMTDSGTVTADGGHLWMPADFS
ncbi:MAG: Peptidase serralysin terminal, partial [Nocardioides sp.]|nr:Peptidase serralysin terminal [Nocardioides sp.]